MKKELKDIREEMIAQLELHLGKSQSPDDDMFYYHPSEIESYSPMPSSG